MEKLEWDDTLNIDVFDMDDRMKQFFVYVNKLIEFKNIKRKKEEDYDSIGETLADISEYIRQHFNHEERLLTQYRYPEFAAHKKEHRRFVKKILAFRRLFSEDPDKIYNDCIDYIREWIVVHINEDDKRYAPFVRVQKYLNDHNISTRRGR